MTEEFDHVIDPKGDMKLILENADAPFAPWPQPATATPNNDTTARAGVKRKLDDSTPDETNKTVAFRISSQHLRLASARSERLRSNAWKDQVHADGLIHVTFEDWSSEALLNILNIIHCRHREVPTTVTLEHLAMIAVIIDYLEPHEAVGFFTDMWKTNLARVCAPVYNRELILNMWICRVFSEEENFEKLKNFAIFYGVGEFNDLGLPFPGTIHGEIQDEKSKRRIIANTGSDEWKAKRQQAKDEIAEKFVELLAGLEDGTKGHCTYCRLSCIGGMWMKLRQTGIFINGKVTFSQDNIAKLCEFLWQRPHDIWGFRGCSSMESLIEWTIQEIGCRFNQCYANDNKFYVHFTLK